MIRLSVITVCATLLLAGCATSNDSSEDISGPDLVSAPQNALWLPVAGIKTPVDSTDGPASTEPVPHGWSHTPQGAVMAAINAQVMMATSDDDLWPMVARYQLAAGPGRDQWAQGRALISISGDVENPAAFEAFRIAEYSEKDAQIILATRYPDVGLTLYPVRLVWDEDWRVVLPTTDSAPDLVPVDNLDDSFTIFRGAL